MKAFKIILVVAVFISLAAFTSKTDNGYSVGDTIVDFRLKNIDDTMLSLSDFGEVKGYVIIFTCNTCPYSVANEDRIIALDKKYKPLGFPVVAINPNDPAVVAGDSFAKMKERANDKGFTFPYLFDEGQKVYPKFGATKTPHVYIVTANDMQVQYIGAIDNSSRDEEAVTEKYAENALDALLVGKTIEKKETRAIGCSIKVQ